MTRSLIVAICGLLLATAGPARAQLAVTQLAQAMTTQDAPARESEPERGLLMGLLKNRSLGRALESNGTQVYGWIQQGFAGNVDSPRDRVNFGVNFDWKSNAYRLNQVYVVLDNTLEQDDRFNVGYRVDFLVGHDAPFFVANGLLSDFTGF